MLLKDSIITKPVHGKTYSLFGDQKSSGPFYALIEKYLSELLDLFPDKESLLIHLQKISNSRRSFNRWIGSNPDIKIIFSELEGYLTDLKKHLRQKTFSRLWNGTIATREHQYLVYFLEFALENKINKTRFLESSYKMALLPHCIRVSIPDCKAKSDGLDIVCINCSTNCFIGRISDILKSKNIKPYIWMQMNFGPTIKKLIKNHGSVGVLGIACIPELIGGMRKCQKYHLPVVGLPLDANRCVRWMGDFYENSVNLNELQSLLSEELIK